MVTAPFACFLYRTDWKFGVIRKFVLASETMSISPLVVLHDIKLMERNMARQTKHNLRSEMLNRRLVLKNVLMMFCGDGVVINIRPR